MTVTLLDPTGPALAARADAVNFSIDTDPAEAIIDVRFPELPLWEIAYRKGTFADAYEGSTLTGSTFHVVRNGGWPSHPRFSVEEQSEALPPPSDLLTPTLYGPLGQWGIGGVGGLDITERVHGRDLTLATLGTPLLPDMRLGRQSLRYSRLTRTDPTFNILGALTVTCKAFYLSTGGDQALVDYATGGETEPTNASYLLRTVTSAGRLSYFAESGSGVNIVFDSTLAMVPGRWHFLSLRRDASGVVTLGRDLDFQTSGALTPPTGGSSNQLSIGDIAITGVPWIGGMSDVSIWSSRLDDNQIGILHTTAMGL